MPHGIVVNAVPVPGSLQASQPSNAVHKHMASLHLRRSAAWLISHTPSCHRFLKCSPKTFSWARTLIEPRAAIASSTAAHHRFFSHCSIQGPRPDVIASPGSAVKERLCLAREAVLSSTRLSSTRLSSSPLDASSASLGSSAYGPFCRRVSPSEHAVVLHAVEHMKEHAVFPAKRRVRSTSSICSQSSAVLVFVCVRVAKCLRQHMSVVRSNPPAHGMKLGWAAKGLQLPGARAN